MDLAGFLRDRAVPDRRLASEAELVDRVGAWIGQQVLGEAVGRVIVDESPVVVRVLPAVDKQLGDRPLECQVPQFRNHIGHPRRRQGRADTTATSRWTAGSRTVYRHSQCRTRNGTGRCGIG